MIVNRRNFLKRSTQSTGALLTGIANGNVLAFSKVKKATQKGITVIIPMPIQVVIDDVGWWSGEDGNKKQEPYRTGISRNHVVADYKAIVELGRALRIRPQAAMVLCEWDRKNILRQLPTSTWMGKNWNNDQWIGSWLEEAADVILGNKENFEFTLHGVGHEYWIDGIFTRAEWATRNGTMRPRNEVEKHLDYFEKIMDQNQLGSFPTSFVPTAFNHGFGRTGDHNISMAELLKQQGVTYINTPFSSMQNSRAVAHKFFGVDDGVRTIDRGADLLDWNIIGKIPTGELKGPTCGLHWPNLLHEDPERNLEIVEGWVKFLEPYNDKLETMLAVNSTAFQNQLAHQTCTKLELADKTIKINFNEFDKQVKFDGNDELTLKIKSASEMQFLTDNVEILSEKLQREADHFLYTVHLKRKIRKSEITINYRHKP